MTENSKKPEYDLEKRTLQFAKDTRIFIRNMPKTLSSIEDGKQVIRSSGSIGANYIEANEALSKKDFLMRIKICRKEAKESIFWLELLASTNGIDLKESNRLGGEAKELMMIFGSILKKSQE